jgi:hypothetical protein
MGLQYVARKRMRVAGRTVEPGEVVPEAAIWKNVKAYVDAGHLAVAVEVPEGEVENTELKVQVAALTERVAALEALAAREADAAVDPEIVEGPDGTLGEQGGNTGTNGEDVAASTSSVEPVDLSEWKLVDLQALAARAGVADPEKFTKKADAAAAIREAVDDEALAMLVAGLDEAQP